MSTTSIPISSRAPRRQQRLSNREFAEAIAALAFDALDRLTAVLFSRRASVDPVEVFTTIRAVGEDRDWELIVILVGALLVVTPPRLRGRVVLAVLAGWIVAHLLFAAAVGTHARAAQLVPSPVPTRLSWRQRAIAKVQSIWKWRN
jgi:hypothetical protein